MPIHRLGEKPSRSGVLADITCDSDGKIDHFIDRREVKDALELHPLDENEYYLGIFLVGAYQEILGDMHNLFGDTNAVQVSLAPNGGYLIDHVVSGDTVTEVLNYVSYNKDDLVARVRRYAESSLRAGRITLGRVRASSCTSTRKASRATRIWSAMWTPSRSTLAVSCGWWCSPTRRRRRSRRGERACQQPLVVVPERLDLLLQHKALAGPRPPRPSRPLPPSSGRPSGAEEGRAARPAFPGV